MTTALTIDRAEVTAASPDRSSRVVLLLSRRLDDFELVEARRAAQPGQSLLFEDVEHAEDFGGPDSLIITPAWSALPPRFWIEQVEGIRARAAAARETSAGDTQRAQEIADDINAAL